MKELNADLQRAVRQGAVLFGMRLRAAESRLVEPGVPKAP